MRSNHKLFQILMVFVVSVGLTLFLFYAMSWYSFNTLPTSAVFQRMLISVAVLMLVLYGAVKLITTQKK